MALRMNGKLDIKRYQATKVGRFAEVGVILQGKIILYQPSNCTSQEEPQGFYGWNQQTRLSVAQSHRC